MFLVLDPTENLSTAVRSSPVWEVGPTDPTQNLFSDLNFLSFQRVAHLQETV